MIIMLKILTVFVLNLLIHPVHVSMSSLEYIPEEKGYRLTVRMYSDDLLLDLLSLYELPADQISDHIYAGPDDIYGKYINERLKVSIDGKAVKSELEEVEKLEIETIMRLFIRHPGGAEEVLISNTILTNIYFDQVNLFIFKDDENELALRFNFNYSEEKLKLGKAE